ncbi:hypothetical protein NIES2104_19710 [Leptolyngbya sp. NIES-2104]|nr:hypothetical protein NIES2104_19710 [Leptolyngbya sp. NIES-2104]
MIRFYSKEFCCTVFVAFSNLSECAKDRSHQPSVPFPDSFHWKP